MSKIDYIFHYLEDTPSRRLNAVSVLPYYKNHTSCKNVIVVEEGRRKTLDIFCRENDLKYRFTESTDNTSHKTIGYNTGAMVSDAEYVCFTDVDVVVDLDVVDRCAERSDCYIGYDGKSLYLKRSFSKKVRQSKDMLACVNANVLKNKSYEHYMMNIDSVSKKHIESCSLSSVGGCLVMTRDILNRVGGFNPRFTGWGFEDSEQVCRMQKLGVHIDRAPQVLFHLYHDIPKNSRAKHRFYKVNREISNLTSISSADQLESMVRSWNHRF